MRLFCEQTKNRKNGKKERSGWVTLSALHTNAVSHFVCFHFVGNTISETVSTDRKYFKQHDISLFIWQLPNISLKSYGIKRHGTLCRLSLLIIRYAPVPVMTGELDTKRFGYPVGLVPSTTINAINNGLRRRYRHQQQTQLFC